MRQPSRPAGTPDDGDTPEAAVGYAYPWDVVGDPGFPDRVHALGVKRVALAASYHSVRAATPMHPQRRLVTARTAALNRPIRATVWAGRRLAPVPADWVPDADPAGTAAVTLVAGGLEVTPWVVLTHATRLGEAHPDVAVVNCFGESYPYALCPQVGEVRDYAATLAAEAVRDLPTTSVVLEACGQLGVVHGGHHEKTDGAFDAHDRRMLSVCCCAACRGAWTRRGLDPEHVVRGLRDGGVEDDELAEVLAARHEGTDRLRAAVLDAVRDATPQIRSVVLHGDPDPWATGPNPGLTPTTADDVDVVVAQCWPTTSASSDRVRDLGRALDGRARAAAYVTVLPPTDPSRLEPHVGALRAAGADEVHLYHLGLAGPERQPLLADGAAAARPAGGAA